MKRFLKINSFYNMLYFATFIVTILSLSRFYTNVEIYCKVMRYVNYIALFLTVPMFLICLDRYRGLNMVMVLVYSLIVLIVGINIGSLEMMWLSYVLIVGAQGIPFRVILKIHFYLILSFCVMNVIGYEMGLASSHLVNVNNRINIFDINVNRLDFGYGWATDFANHVFFILLDYMLLRNGKLHFYEYMFYAIISFVCIMYCDARLSAISILLLILASIFTQKYIKNGWKLGNAVSSFLILTPLIIVAISISSSIIYDASSVNWFAANLILSSRLSLSHNFIIENGFSLFGKTVQLFGQRDLYKIGSEYNYVDSSFVQYSVRYGIVLFSLLIFSFMYIMGKACKRNDIVMVLTLILAVLSGAICQFLFNLVYCVFPVAIFSSMGKRICISNNSFKIIN